MRETFQHRQRMKDFENSEFSPWDNFWLPFKLVAPIVLVIGGVGFALYSLFGMLR